MLETGLETLRLAQKMFYAVISFLKVETWNGENISHYK